MANAYLRTFNVGTGDCIFLVLKSEDNTFSILIDCGNMTNEVESFIRNDLDSHINILIITHIDNDHILGIASIFQTFPNIIIDTILYNCGQFTHLGKDKKAVPENVKHNIKLLSSNSLITSKTLQIGAHHALTIAETILNTPSLKAAWTKQNDYITCDYPDLQLPDGFGRLIFLSPERKAIDAIDKKFQKAFYKYFRVLYDGPYENNESIYEILLRKSTPESSTQQYIGSEKPNISTLNRLCSMAEVNKISPTNTASIAFLWECNDKSILFCGDADPSIIVRYYLLKYTHNHALPFMISAIKVAHHGSSHNSGGKFWETFDSSHIFITGGDSNDQRPSKVCLAKIINRNTDAPRNIYFTRENRSLIWFKSAKNLQKDLNYLICDNSIYEFVY